METKEPEINELKERTVAFVSFKGNFQANKEVFEGLFGKLCGWAGPKGLLGPGVVMLSSYPDDPKSVSPEEMTVDVCMEIADDVTVDGEVKKKVLPGGKYAVMQVELESPEEYGVAWEKIVKWAGENNYEIDASRPSYEIYLNDPKAHPENHHILNMCMSVKEK